MNGYVVPTDLTEEEKEVLGYVSLRQLMILLLIAGPGILFVLFGSVPFVTGSFAGIIKFFVFLFSVGVGGSIAFVKISKYDCYLSQFIIIYFKYLRSQKIFY